MSIEHITRPDGTTKTAVMGDDLSIIIDTGHKPGTLFITTETSHYIDGGYIPNDDAPALALAILEAAGYTDASEEDHAANAVHFLRMASRKHADAKEREALDKEAEALLDASGEYIKFDAMDGSGRDAWRNVALKAREIHGAHQ